MTYWTASAAAKPANRRITAVARGLAERLAKACPAIIQAGVPLAVAFALVFASQAFAQQPEAPPAADTAKPKPPKKPKPAKTAPDPQLPAPPAEVQQQPGQPPAGQPPQQGQQQQVQLVFSPWTKFCLKGPPGQAPDPNAKQICFTGRDARVESGQPVAAAVLIEPEGQERKVLRITLPLGMQLVHGTRMILDQNQPLTAPYVICITNGCMADYDATPDLVGKLKKGQGLVLQAINATGQPMSVVMPLADFAKAYDGPPTDPKVFEEQQRKLQEELQRRADEARKRLEGQGGAPTSSAAPPPPGGKTQ